MTNVKVSVFCKQGLHHCFEILAMNKSDWIEKPQEILEAHLSVKEKGEH